MRGAEGGISRLVGLLNEGSVPPVNTSNGLASSAAATVLRESPIAFSQPRNEGQGRSAVLVSIQRTASNGRWPCGRVGGLLR